MKTFESLGHGSNHGPVRRTRGISRRAEFGLTEGRPGAERHRRLITFGLQQSHGHALHHDAAAAKRKGGAHRECSVRRQARRGGQHIVSFELMFSNRPRLRNHDERV